MLSRLEQAIHRYSMFGPGSRLGVAVSGGADSVCLLHLLLELRAGWRLELEVLHLNHRLRGPDSDADERFVSALALEHGLPMRTATRDARAAIPSGGGNLEETARNLRREFFLAMMREHRLDRVALGHTASDQAETVLFRFLRGSGTAGLAGIRPASSDGFVRPLLFVTRDEVREYMTSRGLPWCEDSSNQSLEFARNRIRHHLLPQLEQDWNPALSSGLTDLAQWALDEELYWSAELDHLATRWFQVAGRTVVTPVDVLRNSPKALARRLVRRACEQVKGGLRGLEFGHGEQILALCGSAEGHGRTQVPGVDVMRSFEWLRFAEPGRDNLETRDFSLELEVPGAVTLPDGARLEALIASESLEPAESGYTQANRDLGRSRFLLEVRNWRPGDAYCPRGFSETVKIKDLFQAHRIPLWERRRWPVVLLGSEIVWSRRFGPADGRSGQTSGSSSPSLPQDVQIAETSGRLET